MGIIVFYKAQRKLLTRLFRERFGVNNGVEISTVDGFQGREKDIIILSCVRAPQGATAGAGAATSVRTTPLECDDPCSSSNASGGGGDTDSCISKDSDSKQSLVGTTIGFLRDWQVTYSYFLFIHSH